MPKYQIKLQLFKGDWLTAKQIDGILCDDLEFKNDKEAQQALAELTTDLNI